MLKYLLPLTIILISGIYLNRSYSHIYSSISDGDLGWLPTYALTKTIEPSAGKSQNTITYIAIGDSLTAGVGGQKGEDSFPYRLSKKIANEKNLNVKLINLGVPGAKSADLKAQLSQIDEKADIITLLIGTNDIHGGIDPGVYQQNVKSTVESISSSTDKLYLLTIPLTASRRLFWPPYRSYFDVQTRRFNKYLNKMSGNLPVKIVDLYSLTKKQASADQYYSADGFHPSPQSYLYWSNLIYDNLN